MCFAKKKREINRLFLRYGKIPAKAFPGRAAILIKMLDLNEKVISAVYEKPNSKKIEIAQKELASITGQFPIITKAKKANASFKLREGMSVGLKVTLRKSKMYEFIDRLINIALPRVRDFRGISDKSFDGKGNYSLGLKEQFIFPEIEYDTVDTPRGMDITIVTTAKTDDEARELLKNFNFPFVK